MAVRRGQRLENILEILNKYSTHISIPEQFQTEHSESLEKKLRMPKLMKNTKN